jgi:hypothetical protein
VNPAPVKRRGKLKGAAKRAFVAKMAAGRKRKVARRLRQRGSGVVSRATFLQRERRRKRRKNTSSAVRSTRGVRTLPARPTGVPRPRPGSKPPGVPNPRRRKRHSSMSKDWGAYGARSASPRRRKKMARRRRRKKLYGAAAAAVARKRGRRRGARRRRRSMASNPAPKRRRRRKASSASPRRRRRRKKSAAAAPRARRRRRRRVSAAAFRTYRRGHGRRRRRKVAHHFGTPRRRRRRRHRLGGSRFASAMRSYGARRRNPRRRRRYRRNPRPSTQRSMLRARRAIRNRYKTALGRATMRRYRMRSNPGGVIIDTLKSAAMIAIPLYGARALSFGLSGRVPLLNRVPAQFQGTVMAAVIGAVAHFATKKIGRLAKYRTQVMIGVGINFLDNILSAVAPASVKTRIGLGDAYADGLGDYIEVGGAPPINDDMTLSDYVEVGDYIEVGAEEELGASVEEELGLEEELGADAYLGGVQQSSMLAPIPRVPSMEAVPQRSFTKAVPRAGAGYDNPRQLYGGVFAGGFGG